MARAHLGCLPDEVRRLGSFVVEDAKKARGTLRMIGLSRPLQALVIRELNEHTPASAVAELAAPLMAGEDMGLLSDAGCPGVADPGALLVRQAHAMGVQVVPLVGPSSLLLALMASGLEGQRFAFCGYLPQRSAERETAIRNIEKRSAQQRETQILIEAPYRNDRLLAALLGTCAGDTWLCLATDLTLAGESIKTYRVREWRTRARPRINRRPTVFLLLAESRSAHAGRRLDTDQRLP